jgi:hypothetical protein
MKIVGAEGMSTDQLRFEIQRGAKLVVYQYAISILIMSFRRASNTRYISAGQSAVSKGLPWTGLTLIAGWWGIPWGPIFSIQALITNFKGGKDVTAEIIPTVGPSSSAEGNGDQDLSKKGLSKI